MTFDKAVMHWFLHIFMMNFFHNCEMFQVNEVQRICEDHHLYLHEFQEVSKAGQYIYYPMDSGMQKKVIKNSMCSFKTESVGTWNLGAMQIMIFF